MNPPAALFVALRSWADDAHLANRGIIRYGDTKTAKVRGACKSRHWMKVYSLASVDLFYAFRCAGTYHPSMTAARPEMLRPPPDWPPTEAEILDELSDAPIAVELWLCVRKARLWMETPPDARSRLFRRSKRDSGKERRRAAFGAYPELHEPLRAFAALVANPGKIDAATLCSACTRLADWAAENSFEGTAVHFAVAAAAVAPENPEAANLAGLMCRRAGDLQRAEMFYPRAIALARRQ